MQGTYSCLVFTLSPWRTDALVLSALESSAFVAVTTHDSGLTNSCRLRFRVVVCTVHNIFIAGTVYCIHSIALSALEPGDHNAFVIDWLAAFDRQDEQDQETEARSLSLLLVSTPRVKQSNPPGRRHLVL